MPAEGQLRRRQLSVRPLMKPAEVRTAIETALKGCAEVDAGAGVATTRGHVEYGAVDLHGRPFHERAAFRVSIAHPNFRLAL